MNYTSQTFKNLYNERLRKSELKSRRQVLEFMENEKGLDGVVKEQIAMLQTRLHYPIKKDWDCTSGRISKILSGWIFEEIMSLCVIESDSYLQKFVDTAHETFKELNNERFPDELDFPPVAMSIPRDPTPWMGGTISLRGPTKIS